MPFILLCLPISRSSAIFFSFLLLQEHIRGFPWWFIAFQCRGCRFNPWLGSQDPTCLAAKKKKKKPKQNIKQKQYCNKFNKDLKKKKKKEPVRTQICIPGNRNFQQAQGCLFRTLESRRQLLLRKFHISTCR